MFNTISISTISTKVKLMVLMGILFFMALPFFMMSAAPVTVESEGVEVAGYIWTDDGQPDDGKDGYIWTD